MGLALEGTGFRDETDKKAQRVPFHIFESLRFTGMPQDRQYDRQADATNGPSLVFDFLLPWIVGPRQIRHKRLGAHSQLRSMQSTDCKKNATAGGVPPNE